MLCQRCLKKTASYHSPKIVNNEIVYIHLCKDCVTRKNEHEAHNGLDDKLHYMFEGLIKPKDGEDGAPAETRCEKCGTTIKEYKKNHLLGCPHCYDVFTRYFIKDLEGKKMVYPREVQADGIANQLVYLRNELKRAVEEENFERAAELRDTIQQCEKRGLVHDN